MKLDDYADFIAGVLLYEESIALLTDKYEATKKLVKSKGRLVLCELTLTGLSEL